MSLLLEICVDSVEAACAARDAGAARVELCSALSEGGVTPSRGLIDAVRSNIDIRLHVLIRPRGGDFLYSDAEFGVMRRDIDIAGEAGADGIVTGMLTSDGKVDIDRTALLAEYAAPMSVTFHRAFDMCRDGRRALNDLIVSGCERVLTSGQASKAVDGADLLSDLVKIAGDRIIVMPGGGIDEYNIAALARITGAREFHMSARKSVESLMTFRRKGISMGGNRVISEYSWKTADEERIKTVIKILNSIEI